MSHEPTAEETEALATIILQIDLIGLFHGW